MRRVLNEHPYLLRASPDQSRHGQRETMKYCPSCHKTYPGDYNVCPADQTQLQSSLELQPGMIIRSKYEILSRIGVGGMGAVYKGRHVTFNELCAIKVVNDSIAGDKNFLQRFQTEAVVTRKLRHPNAVRVDDFDYTDDGRPFIVMELVEGRNVGEILQSEGPLPVPRAIRIATEAARALGAAHKLGFVHRDIKPGNIVLTTNEQGQEVAKVLDFGIAKLRQAAGDAQSGVTMTMTGMVVGTPLYMSPEQFMGKKAAGEIDGRTDLYSLGVVLYQMVTARLPFEGDTLYSIMVQHIEGNVRPPDELAPELNIPPALSKVVLKAIEKSRELRFQTAEEFVAALEQLTNDAASSTLVEAPVASLSSVTSTPSQSAQITQPPAARPAQSSQVSSPPPSAAPVSVQPPGFTPVPVAALPTQPPLPKSAAQHVFIQQRTFKARNIVVLIGLCLALAVIAGVGYLKYRSVQRLKIENAIVESLKNAPSLGVRTAHINVSVSDTGEVILDGDVPSLEDSNTAASLSASVPGVSRVNNRLRLVPSLNSAANTNDGGSSDSLIRQGLSSMDAGNYSTAIDCFTKAANDPNNKSALKLLETARRAQKTEEELLRRRR